jgi:Fumarase
MLIKKLEKKVNNHSSKFFTEHIEEKVVSLSCEKITDFPEYLSALLKIRKAAAAANEKLHLIEHSVAQNIINACSRVEENIRTNGLSHYPVLRFIGKPAHRAIDEEIAKHLESADPNTAKAISINQYTVDVTGTAEAAAVHMCLANLAKALKVVSAEINKKGAEFSDVVKCGRLGLKDALPVRMGDEFRMYAAAIDNIIQELEEEKAYWTFNLLGLSDQGLGVGVHPEFKETVAQFLEKEVGYPVRTLAGHEEMLFQQRYLIAHAKVKAASTLLWKAARSLTLLASGPRAGIRELVLPAVAPGSSIMPGKINPTVSELMMNICDKVYANDSGMSIGIHSGWLGTGSPSSLPLKTFINSCQLLSDASYVFKEKVLSGITVNKERCRSQAARSLAFETLVSSLVGEAKADEILQIALKEDLTLEAASALVELTDRQKVSLKMAFDLDLISTPDGVSQLMRNAYSSQV